MLVAAADGFLHLVFPGAVRDEAFRLFYNRLGQLSSVGNYWNDPRHQDSYREYSQFLAPVDNEVSPAASCGARPGPPALWPRPDLPLTALCASRCSPATRSGIGGTCCV